MGLKSKAEKVIDKIFDAFKDAVKSGQYDASSDDGWGTTLEAQYTVRVIFDQFSQEDVSTTSFYDLIQPTDVKGLMPAKDLPVSVKTSHKIVIGDKTYAVKAFDIDPFEVLYTLLLRNV